MNRYGATVVSVQTQEDLQAMIEAVRREGVSGPPRGTEHPRREGWPDRLSVLWLYLGSQEYGVGVGGGRDLAPLRAVLHRLHESDLPLVERLLADQAAASKFTPEERAELGRWLEGQQ